MNIVSSNIIYSIKVDSVPFSEIRKIHGSQIISVDYPALEQELWVPLFLNVVQFYRLKKWIKC